VTERIAKDALECNAQVKSKGIVLHVEDDPLVRQGISLVLSAEGYEVSGAASGAEALSVVAQGLRPDVLIVDFRLDNDMNGAEATEQIHKALGYPTPIIMLTADPSSAEFPWIIDAPVWLARKQLDRQQLLAAMPGLVQVSRSIR